MKIRKVLFYVLQYYGLDADLPTIVTSGIEKHVKHTCIYFEKIWKMQGRSKQKVFAHYANYFRRPFQLSENILSLSKAKSVGRNIVPFEVCSKATKRKKNC